MGPEKLMDFDIGEIPETDKKSRLSPNMRGSPTAKYPRTHIQSRAAPIIDRTTAALTGRVNITEPTPTYPISARDTFGFLAPQ